MDTPQTKKEDSFLGDIQVTSMPGTTAGNPPNIKAPVYQGASPTTFSPVEPVAVKSVSSIAPGQVAVDAGLAQRLNQQKNIDKKPIKKTITLVLLGLLVIILGGGAYWYYAYGQTMLLVRQIVFKLEAPYQNYVSNFDLVMEVKANDSNLSGATSDPLNMFLPDANDVNMKISGVQHAVGQDYDGQAQITLKAGSYNFDSSTEYKQIGKEVFFRFNKDFLSELLGGFGMDFSEFFNKDRWLTYNWDDLNKTTDPNYDFSVNLKNYNLDKALAQRKKMDDYLQQFKFSEIFKIEDTKEVKDSSGEKLKKFKLIIKPSKVDELMTMLFIFNPEYSQNEELKNNQEIRAKIEGDLAKIKAKNADGFASIESGLADLEIFIWVNTKTKSVQGAKLALSAHKFGQVQDSGPTITGYFEFLNQAEDAYQINRPESTITVQQAYENTINNIKQKQLEKMKQYEEQNNKDSDNDGLSDVMESFYGTDVLKSDTDNDGFLDGEEVNNGYNPLGPGKLDLGTFEP